ncbi:MAG: hypothetical protein R2939_22235 [Kofleriaceae bacterium]
MQDEATPRFKAATGGVAAVAVLGIVALRFCGTPPLPGKPPPPVVREGERAGEVLRESAGTSNAWAQFVRQDAHAAALPDVDPASLTKVLPYHGEDQRQIMTVDGAPLEAGGLRLSLSVEPGVGDKILVMTIENLSNAYVAYQVATETSLGAQACSTRMILRHNAVTLAPGATEKRSECIYRPDMKLVVVRAETLELTPLSAWYLSRVPPSALALDTRASQGHATGPGACTTSHPQTLKAAIQRGQTTWRDLVDFYARHRCESYDFPKGYSYFKVDGERELPATAS